MTVAELPFSPRQREVVELRLAGEGRRQIAHALGVTPRTVRAHIDEARRAIGARDETDLLLRVDRLRRA